MGQNFEHQMLSAVVDSRMFSLANEVNNSGGFFSKMQLINPVASGIDVILWRAHLYALNVVNVPQVIGGLATALITIANQVNGQNHVLSGPDSVAESRTQNTNAVTALDPPAMFAYKHGDPGQNTTRNFELLGRIPIVIPAGQAFHMQSRLAADDTGWACTFTWEERPAA